MGLRGADPRPAAAGRRREGVQADVVADGGLGYAPPSRTSRPSAVDQRLSRSAAERAVSLGHSRGGGRGRRAAGAGRAGRCRWRCGRAAASLRSMTSGSSSRVSIGSRHIGPMCSGTERAVTRGGAAGADRCGARLCRRGPGRHPGCRRLAVRNATPGGDPPSAHGAPWILVGHHCHRDGAHAKKAGGSDLRRVVQAVQKPVADPQPRGCLSMKEEPTTWSALRHGTSPCRGRPLGRRWGVHVNRDLLVGRGIF